MALFSAEGVGGTRLFSKRNSTSIKMNAKSSARVDARQSIATAIGVAEKYSVVNVASDLYHEQRTSKAEKNTRHGSVGVVNKVGLRKP